MALEDVASFDAKIQATTFRCGAIGDAVTLDPDAVSAMLTTTDDDNLFEDAFFEDGAQSVLATDFLAPAADGGFPTFAAGQRVENEFTLTAVSGSGDIVTFCIVRIGGVGSNDGQNAPVFSDSELIPGETYTLTAGTGGPEVPFENVICFCRGALIATPRGTGRSKPFGRAIWCGRAIRARGESSGSAPGGAPRRCCWPFRNCARFGSARAPLSATCRGAICWRSSSIGSF